MRSPGAAMIHLNIRIGLVALLSTGLVLAGRTGLAQAPPASPAPPGIQNQPAPSSPLPPQDTSLTAPAASAGGLVVTPASGVGANRSSSIGKSFGSAGNGLPGMPGGPPVNSPLGAQDPSGKYMRPPKIPPVLCDPAIDLPC